jgi:muramoyltetrapeptide carboxypeptidase LdcA involved in peptidoglycan recycling
LIITPYTKKERMIIMKKVKKLKPGSKIAIISPSNGLPHKYPDIYELGLKNLREVLGFKIVELPTARMSTEELYNNPKLRADDINRAFEDESVDGIIASIGGYESVRILKYLDKDIILNNPKLIMGFSDSTAFLSYLNKLGLVTFYGPSVMAGFAQLNSLPVEFQEHLKSFLFSNEIPYSYPSYQKWTNGYKDWNNKKVLGECTEFMDNNGWNFLQKGKKVQGKLWGGCIEVLEFLKATDYWPDKDFWNDKILFFETSEDKPLPDNVGYMLRNYGIQGALERIKGIMFGRPKDYSEEEKQELNTLVMNIMRKEFNVTDIPVVMNVDFGHTDPKIILPLGCEVEIDPEAKRITLLENPFI